MINSNAKKCDNSQKFLLEVVGRHNVYNRAELKTLLNILSSDVGSPTNMAKLSAAFKTIKHKTISKSERFRRKNQQG